MIHFMTDETRTERFGNQICTTHNVDGYTTRKTILGAVHEIGKAIAKIDAGEGEILTSVKTEAEAKQALVSNCFTEKTPHYCFELEEVSCASEWDEEKEEMKCEDGNFYFHIRFFVWEEIEAEENETETEAQEQQTTEERGEETTAAQDPEKEIIERIIEAIKTAAPYIEIILYDDYFLTIRNGTEQFGVDNSGNADECFNYLQAFKAGIRMYKGMKETIWNTPKRSATA